MNQLPEDRRDRFCSELEDLEFRPMTLEQRARIEREAKAGKWEIEDRGPKTTKNHDK